MIERKQIYVFIVLLTLGYCLTFSKGSDWKEIKSKISPFFGSDLIKDIESSDGLIQKYDIYGWDVGDFTGDGYPDFAFSARSLSKKNTMNVFLFADIESYLVKIGEFEKKIVSLPLEVGVAIKDNAVFITEKQSESNWIVEGYSYIENSLELVELYTTKSNGGITEEISEGYYGRPSVFNFRKSQSGELIYSYKYYSLGISEKNETHIGPLITTQRVRDVSGIIKGNYWWKDWDDASYNIGYIYDGSLLHCYLDVKDDEVIKGQFGERFTIDVALTEQIERKPKKKGGSYVNTTLSLETQETELFLFSESKEERLDYPIISNITESGYSCYFSIPLATPQNSDRNQEIFIRTTLYDIDSGQEGQYTEFSSSPFSNSELDKWFSLIVKPLTLTDGRKKQNKFDKILSEYGLD